jgi:hypothetical protein
MTNTPPPLSVESGEPSEMTAREFIEKIAAMSEAIGWQAGVGASETAGMIVSYLAANPDDFDTVMTGGILDLPPGWHEFGRLSWMGMNGQVVRPEQVRRARMIKLMEQGKPA